MVVRIILGILLGYLIIAYFPIIMRKIHYVIIAALGIITIYFLRAAPLIAEPLSFGLLMVVLCYILYLLLRYRGNWKNMLTKAREYKVKLPIINIANHPQISVLFTISAYTAALTFLAYMVILLMYVN